ncbi:hypothetical protein NHX12_014325 [Muraenolepis orangiensis]|uniref:ubiquitinyl hydrolase 1 n=1 Tax=Muraenolepis orangiensis TaxID=630683 RepID=A0A9Q0DC20_9TELE|nr:hypothetical protein NHX12_014325 [Muraenolepis orangiensis]
MEEGGHPSEKRMDDFFMSLGLKRKKIAKDGSCLFRAVAEQVLLCQSRHTEVRARCVEFLKDNRELYEAFIEGDFEDYHWVGEVEMNALAIIYKRDFLIFQEPGKAAVNITANGFKDQIQLCFLNGNHYDCVYPISHIQNTAFCQSLLYELLYERVFKEDRSVLGMGQRGGRRSELTDDHMAACPSSDESETEDPIWIQDEASKQGGQQNRGRGRGRGRGLSERLRRSLNPNLLRNVDYDVWLSSKRVQQKKDFCMAAGLQYSVGDPCQVSLEEGGRSYRGSIRKVSPSNGPVTVYVEEQGREVSVPLLKLCPVSETSWKSVVTGEKRTNGQAQAPEWVEPKGRGKLLPSSAPPSASKAALVEIELRDEQNFPALAAGQVDAPIPDDVTSPPPPSPLPVLIPPPQHPAPLYPNTSELSELHPNIFNPLNSKTLCPLYPNNLDPIPLYPSPHTFTPPSQPEPGHGTVPLQQLSQLHQDLLYPGFPTGCMGDALATPAYSYSKTGDDLPPDLDRIRWFFNLGVKAYNHPMLPPFIYLQRAAPLQPGHPSGYPSLGHRPQFPGALSPGLQLYPSDQHLPSPGRPPGPGLHHLELESYSATGANAASGSMMANVGMGVPAAGGPADQGLSRSVLLIDPLNTPIWISEPKFQDSIGAGTSAAHGHCPSPTSNSGHHNYRPYHGSMINPADPYVHMRVGPGLGAGMETWNGPEPGSSNRRGRRGNQHQRRGRGYRRSYARGVVPNHSHYNPAPRTDQGYY